MKIQIKHPLVSVIVTTKNSETTLRKCLTSVRNQTYKNIELIIVDNYSNDKTYTISKRFADKVIKRGHERSAQRNVGANTSKGLYLLFLDSDMYLTKNVIKECVEFVKIKNVDGLYIPEKIIGSSFYVKIRNFERQFYTGTVIDAVRFVSKKIFDKIGGFDEKLYAGEDWDFDKQVRRMGKTATIKSFLHHDESTSNFFSYIQKKAYYSLDIKHYRDKWPNDNDVQKQLGFWYRYMQVFIENGKWKHLIKNPILTCGMMCLKICVGALYLLSRIK